MDTKSLLPSDYLLPFLSFAASTPTATSEMIIGGGDGRLFLAFFLFGMENVYKADKHLQRERDASISM